jgi:hypothetical protein
MSTGQISIQLWPLQRTIYIPKVGSCQILDQTHHRSTPTKTKTVLPHLYLLPNTYYERIELEEICIPANYHPSSGHYIELSIFQKLDLDKYWTGPTAISPQPRPRQYSNIYISFLIHTMKWWNYVEEICLPAKYQSSSGHYIELSM